MTSTFNYINNGKVTFLLAPLSETALLLLYCPSKNIVSGILKISADNSEDEIFQKSLILNFLRTCDGTVCSTNPPQRSHGYRIIFPLTIPNSFIVMVTDFIRHSEQRGILISVIGQATKYRNGSDL